MDKSVDKVKYISIQIETEHLANTLFILTQTKHRAENLPVKMNSLNLSYMHYAGPAEYWGAH